MHHNKEIQLISITHKLLKKKSDCLNERYFNLLYSPVVEINVGIARGNVTICFFAENKIGWLTQHLPAFKSLKIRIICAFTKHGRIKKEVVCQTKTELSPQKSRITFVYVYNNSMVQGIGL